MQIFSNLVQRKHF